MEEVIFFNHRVVHMLQGRLGSCEIARDLSMVQGVPLRGIADRWKARVAVIRTRLRKAAHVGFLNGLLLRPLIFSLLRFTKRRCNVLVNVDGLRVLELLEVLSLIKGLLLLTESWSVPTIRSPRVRDLLLTAGCLLSIGVFI